MSKEFTAQETATILAALRYYQTQFVDLRRLDSEMINNIATECGTFEAMNSVEIDALCESINCGDPSNASADDDESENSIREFDLIAVMGCNSTERHSVRIKASSLKEAIQKLSNDDGGVEWLSLDSDEVNERELEKVEYQGEQFEPDYKGLEP